MAEYDVIIAGAGLAGSEAAYQLAESGYKVNLIEMRPLKTTPAHETDKFAELVWGFLGFQKVPFKKRNDAL